SSGTVASSRKASKATFALNAASNFLRDFVISLAPLVKTEQDATHLNRWSQNRGPLQLVPAFFAIKGTSSSSNRRGRDRPFNRSLQVRHSEGLLNEDSFGAQRDASHRIAGHEHVRDKLASKDLFDRGYAAGFAKSDIDDHQIRAPMGSGGHRIGEIALYGADGVTETLERFREQFADHRVVFHDQGAQRLHRITSPPAPRSFSQTATLSNDPEVGAAL